MKHPLWTILGAAAFLAGGGVWAQRAEPTLTATPALSAEEREHLEEAAAASLFGQFRSNMADFLYLKVDKYLHKGVDLRGLTEAEKTQQGVELATTHPDEDGPQHHEETTVVPEKARDWRGVFGDFERAVQPYQGMEAHSHIGPEDSLPLFRLMVKTNPRFVPGYVLGAMMIRRDRAKLNDAVAFLQEGARNNPRSIEIQSELGATLTSHKKDFAQGAKHLVQAIQLGAERDPKTLTTDEEEALIAAYRWLILNRRDAGDKRGQQAAAQLGHARFPEDPIIGKYAEGQRGN